MKALLVFIILGLIAGYFVGEWMADSYWQNEGKTRAVTFLAYETYGLIGGAILGGVFNFFTARR